MLTRAAKPEGIFTIGHSTHELARFVDLLKRNGIAAVADVRSMPYSRRQRQFNREELAESLKTHEIAYVHLGEELGARSDNPACYKNGRVQFKRLAETPQFRSGIQRVLDGSQRMSIALMCAEKDPLDCHRTILVARDLVGLGKEVNHILADGEIETHQAAMQRLCQRLGIQEDLIRASEELEDDAYAEQERNIAFRAA